NEIYSINEILEFDAAIFVIRYIKHEHFLLKLTNTTTVLMPLTILITQELDVLNNYFSPNTVKNNIDIMLTNKTMSY
ncbi:hypothetical protein, partial [Staphylococcus aureus]